MTGRRRQTSAKAAGDPFAYGCPVLEAIPENTAYDVIVDAIFGVGLSRNVEGIFADTIRKMNEIPGKKIALDMPSGISSDTGAV